MIADISHVKRRYFFSWSFRADGFTLLELMVSVFVISVLIAIAIPTFLGLREKAEDKAVQSHLRYVLAAELSFYTENLRFAGLPAELAGEMGPGISLEVLPSGNPEEISLFLNGIGTDVIMGARSDSGTCFYIRQVVGTAVQYAEANAAICPTNPAIIPVLWRDKW